MRHMAPFAAVLLGGCIVGPNSHPPAAATPPTFVEPRPGVASPVDLAKPWNAFGDPVLTNLIERALRDNPDIQLAASRVRQVRLQEIGAPVGGRPVVNADASATYLKFSKNVASPRSPASSAVAAALVVAAAAASRCPAARSPPMRSGSTRAGSSISSAAIGAL